MIEKKYLFIKAISFAEKAHLGQVRRDGITAQIEHPKSVDKILTELHLEDTFFYRIVAYLHDVIEDTDYTYEDLKEEFNLEIANAVLELTKKKNEKKID